MLDPCAEDSPRYTRPIVAANVKRIANHVRSPLMEPQMPCRGLAATDDCQYAWSPNIVPKLPTMFIISNTRPSEKPKGYSGLLNKVWKTSTNFKHPDKDKDESRVEKANDVL